MIQFSQQTLQLALSAGKQKKPLLFKHNSVLKHIRFPCPPCLPRFTVGIKNIHTGNGILIARYILIPSFPSNNCGLAGSGNHCSLGQLRPGSLLPPFVRHNLLRAHSRLLALLPHISDHSLSFPRIGEQREHPSLSTQFSSISNGILFSPSASLPNIFLNLLSRLKPSPNLNHLTGH